MSTTETLHESDSRFDTHSDVEKPPVEQKPLPPPTYSNLAKCLQVLSSFVVYMNTWGFLQSSGAFQTYYEQHILKNYSGSDISWILTVCAFLVVSAGIVTGPLYDNGLYRSVIGVGSLLQVFGLMMLSLSTKYYQVFLSHGLCVGIGAGIIFVPSMSAAASCITDPAMRVKIMALISCGGSVGGIVYPIAFHSLVNEVGFPRAVRIIAFIILGLYLCAYLDFTSGPRKGGKTRRMFDPTIMRDVPFLSLTVANFLNSIAYFLPLVFLPTIAEVKVPGMSESLAFDLIAILNAAAGVGRICTGFLAKRFGSTETFMTMLVFGTVILYCWQAAVSVAGVVVWTIAWGAISGVAVGLQPSMVVLFSPSLSIVGTRGGIYWLFIGLGVLVGSPIGGRLLKDDLTDNQTWRLSVFAGTAMLLSAVFFIYPVVYARRLRKASGTS